MTTTFKTFLAEEATPKLTWSVLVKKYGMVNGPRYHDSGTVPKQIKNKQGSVLVQIDHHSDKDMFVTVERIDGNKRLAKDVKSLDELDKLLSTIKLDAVVPKADDAKILKFLSKVYMLKIKDLNDLTDNWTFIKWSKAIEMKDYDHRAVYTTLVNGNSPGDDEEGLGEIGMTVDELKAWLLEKGVKQSQKPKRIPSGSLYD